MNAEQEPERGAEQQPTDGAPRRVPGRPFARGTSGNPGGQPRGEAGRRPPRLLRDMRRAYEKAGGQGGSPGQQALRKLLAENPKEFVAQMAGLEKAYLASAGKKSRPEAPPAPTDPDVLTGPKERCEQAVDEFLQEFREEQAALERAKAFLDDGGAPVVEAWGGLTPEARQEVLAIVSGRK